MTAIHIQPALRFIFAAALLATSFSSHAQAAWKAGAARVVITPASSMPMAGYAGRGAKHATGKLTDLSAKALVLEDEAGSRAVLITLDLIGVDRGLSQAVCSQLEKKFGLKRRQVAINASHTHTGPVVATNLRPMHYMMLDDANRKRVDDYAANLVRKIVAVTGSAIADLSPADISWGSGAATFAVNRRNNPEAKVPELRTAGALAGPFDHDVPVLAVHKNKKLAAVVFGYACHCTVLSSYEWSGDYAGFAQLELEKTHDGCVAMFWAGCGGDQNPLPRRKVEFAKAYGKRLAAAVEKILTTEAQLHNIQGGLTPSYQEIELPLATLPTTAELKQQANSANKYIQSRAEHLLTKVHNKGKLKPTYSYPVGVWKIGDDVRMVFLGGEVVVDYALRLKQEAAGKESSGSTSVWVAGYSNDVMAYIPSRRVLREGGYEGGGAMVYYGLPTIWAPEVENLIINEVKRQLR